MMKSACHHNPKRKKMWVRPSKSSTSKPKQDIHENKATCTLDEIKLLWCTISIDADSC